MSRRQLLFNITGHEELKSNIFGIEINFQLKPISLPDFRRDSSGDVSYRSSWHQSHFGRSTDLVLLLVWVAGSSYLASVNFV